MAEGLAEARQQAFANRRIARSGGDPVALKRQGNVPTFEEAAKDVIDLHAGNWKDGGKNRAQWWASLHDYAMPRLGHLRVSAVSTAESRWCRHLHTRGSGGRRGRFVSDQFGRMFADENNVARGTSEMRF